MESVECQRDQSALFQTCLVSAASVPRPRSRKLPIIARSPTGAEWIARMNFDLLFLRKIGTPART